MVKAGDMLSALGREKEATARYREVQRRYPATPAGERVAGLLRLREMEAQARALYGDYRFADARKLFETLAREDPARQARMEFCLVLCLYGQGLDEEAARRARALAEGNAEEAVRAEASRWLAKLAYNQGRWREAADLFSAAADARGTPADVAAESLVWAARAACAGNDYPRAVATVARFVSHHAASPLLAAALTVQGEALIELARFDEAVLVFDRAVAAAGASADDRLRAELLRADALFAMGADNPARYHAALTAYQTALLGENLTATQRVTLSFKIARTLEKLKRTEEAVDQYYTQVVLAYRAGVARGESYEDEARAVFSRAALRLADEYESRGRDFQAIRVLELVVASRVPAADEAARRIARLRRKGDSL
jgi:TolA-binding protein